MPWIEREPVRHNLIATIVAKFASSDGPVGRELVLWKVVDGDETIAGVAIQTPPMPMLLTEMPPAALEAVAVAAKAEGLQRFAGPGARRLAELAAGDTPIRMSRSSGLHRLRRVVPPQNVPGHARLAGPGDAWQVFLWVQGFQAEVGDEEPLRLSQVEDRIAGQGVWVWEHEHNILSMAAWTKPVHGVARINLVYTPPGQRGHGYASALVAAVSQAVLDNGHIPILYTDLANPTSNKIYAAVGFEKIDEPELWEIHYEVRTTTVEAVNNLAVRWASQADPQATTVFSSASVWPLLALLADAATGTARDELLAAVGPGSQLLPSGTTGPGITIDEFPSFDPTPELCLITRPFTIESGHDLLAGDNAVLFGLSSATDTSFGHFPGISRFPLAISKARQDAMAAFSAYGFEAAAVTAFGGVAAGVPPHTKQVLMVEFVPPFGFLAVHRPPVWC